MSDSRGRWLSLVALLVALTTCAFAAAPAVADVPPNIRRIVFLGDSITYGGGYVNAFAAYFATRHPQRPLEIINVGLSSETVSGLSEDGHAQGKFPRPDLHERLARVLAATKPDLVIACYGMNDGIYLPLEAERFRRYQDGLQRLRAAVAAIGARIVHVTPAPYDDVRGGKTGYGAVLEHYAAWIMAQRTAANWEVIDVNGPLRRVLSARQKQEPGFFLSRDGVHPGDYGHWLMAREILRHFGARDLEGVESAAAMVAGHPQGAKLLELVTQRQVLLRDAWLTATGHQRPGVRAGLPLPEAQAKAREIDGQLAALR
jgi:lysophospholipase L1-like esterase